MLNRLSLSSLVICGQSFGQGQACCVLRSAIAVLSCFGGLMIWKLLRRREAQPASHSSILGQTVSLLFVITLAAVASCSIGSLSFCILMITASPCTAFPGANLLGKLLKSSGIQYWLDWTGGTPTFSRFFPILISCKWPRLWTLMP